jgi:hypothetical protein
MNKLSLVGMQLPEKYKENFERKPAKTSKFFLYFPVVSTNESLFILLAPTYTGTNTSRLLYIITLISLLFVHAFLSSFVHSLRCFKLATTRKKLKQRRHAGNKIIAKVLGSVQLLMCRKGFAMQRRGKWADLNIKHPSQGFVKF